MDIILVDETEKKVCAVTIEQLYKVIKLQIEKYTCNFEVADINDISYAMNALVNWQPILAWLPFITRISLYRGGTDTSKWFTTFVFKDGQTIRTTTLLERKLYDEFM